MSSLPIDVVVVAYNSDEVIDACLSAARAIPGVQSIVVVDHGAGNAARRAAASGAVGLVPGRNAGFGAGQNRGIAAGAAPLVLMLNPDAEVVSEAVGAGAELLARRPHAAAVQGSIKNRTTGGLERSQGLELGPVHLIARALGLRRWLGQGFVRAAAARWATLADHVNRLPPAEAEVESLAATALLVRRSAFEAVGGFDETFFLYGEDLDLCRRLRLAGWELVAVPDLWATHESGGSATSNVQREMEWWRGTMAFGARWWRGWAWAGALGAATLQFARLAVSAPHSRAKALEAVVLEPVRVRRRCKGESG